MDASECHGLRFELGLLEDPAEMSAMAYGMREPAAPITDCALRLTNLANAQASEADHR